MSDLTPADRADLRRRHARQAPPYVAPYCEADGEPWPCLPIGALDALERAEVLVAWRRGFLSNSEAIRALNLSGLSALMGMQDAVTDRGVERARQVQP